MSELEAVRLLRYAAASVWTELENEAPDLDGLQILVDQALDLTGEYAPRGKDLTDDGVGVAGWRQHLVKKGIRTCPSS